MRFRQEEFLPAIRLVVSVVVGSSSSSIWGAEVRFVVRYLGVTSQLRIEQKI